MTCPPGKLKPTCTVLCHRVDCGDEEVFILDGCESLTLKQARDYMLADYEVMCEMYDQRKHGEASCRHEVTANEIRMDVPIWDGERSQEGWIRCHWTIVEH